jgi:hypothetical protein
MYAYILRKFKERQNTRNLLGVAAVQLMSREAASQSPIRCSLLRSPQRNHESKDCKVGSRLNCGTHGGLNI